MVRRSTSGQRRAERYFPVRMRVLVPPCGLGTELDAMHAWLHAQFGRHGYWIGSEAGPGLADAVLIYFLDVPSAQAFVDRFACGRHLRAPEGSTPP